LALLRIGIEGTSSVNKKIPLSNFSLLLNSPTNNTNVVKQIKLISKNNLYYSKAKEQVINKTFYLNGDFVLFA
jgi:hypothetical protein